MDQYQEKHPRWSDFHCWFPNQAFRREPHNKQQLVQDLDNVLEEINFPLERFYELMNEWSRNGRRIRNIYVNARQKGREPTIKEEQEMNLIEAREKERAKELDELIDPVYQRMLDMEYSSRELQYLS